VLHGPDEPQDFSRPLQLLAQSVRFTDPHTGQDRLFESQLQLSL
jgi:tRNA pseudouridine32 synthase/23S rRNA pseudouridine746 synthase